MLFRASSFMPPESEAKLLTDLEKEMIGKRREFWRTKQVLIAELDTEVLRSPTISVEMPDRSVYSFSGAAQDALGAPGYFRWAETADVVPANAASSNGPPAIRRTYFQNSLELFFDRKQNWVLGKLVIGRQRFHFQGLNARYTMLVEEGLNPSSPPIDAEPPGARPSRPRPSPDWPPRLLTDKLRASLATSSIGASLSPQHCDQVTSCGVVTRISCHPEVDGPEMFFDNKTGVLIMACGGSCMMGSGLPGSKRCTACPPPEWDRCNGGTGSARR
jgi:hypothetical protein